MCSSTGQFPRRFMLPISQLGQQPIPVAIDRFLASHLPDATALHRQKVFDDTANLFGGFDGAVAYFQCSIDVIASGVVLGVRPSFSSLFPTINVRCRPSALLPMPLSNRPTSARWQFSITRLILPTFNRTPRLCGTSILAGAGRVRARL